LSLKIKRRFYIPDPSDSLASRVHRRLTRRRVPDFPRTVQIQTATGCNADCIFCPYGETYPLLPKGRMDWDVFESLVEETARHGVRRISPYLMNEPFADPEIFDRIRMINRINPAAKVVVTSNGGLLTQDRVDRLLDLGDGVHALYLSVQGIDEEAYEKTMRGGMRFRKTMANVDYLLEAMKKRGARRPEIWVTMVDTDVIDARKSVAYWSSRGVRSKYTKLENRGGNIHDANEISRSHAMRPFTDCTRLFKQAFVMFNGDVVLCCTDYRKTMVLGNTRDGGLHGVWNSDRAVAIRQAYIREDFSENSLCGTCTIDREVEVSHVPKGARRLPRLFASS
jgi:MoaA/NifB/PqqE/SkfB family radical SAM enzyme